MRVSPSTLALAFALSLLLHAGALELATALMPKAVRAERLSNPLDVRLREAAVPAVPLALPKLKLDPSLHASAARAAPASPQVLLAPQRGGGARQRSHVPRGLAGDAAESAYRQMARSLYYPREAIAQGLDGEATVLLFLDEQGNAIAARLEKTSGHALLDDAAVRAARSLRGLPASAPREALLPVVFRLR